MIAPERGRYEPLFFETGADVGHRERRETNGYETPSGRHPAYEVHDELSTRWRPEHLRGQRWSIQHSGESVETPIVDATLGGCFLTLRL